VTEAILLHDHYELHAGIDCSDGLSLDLARICEESGCGAVIDVDHVPIAAAAIELAGTPTAAGDVESGPAQPGCASPLEHALGDGEDFELILAVPPADATRMIVEAPHSGIALTDIGQFVSERGLWQRDSAGNMSRLAPRGWVHR
jgi:thiamine-monophosphate kinase